MKFEVRFSANSGFCYSDWLIWGSQKVKPYVDRYSTGAGCELQVWITITPSKLKLHNYIELTPRHMLRGSDAADKKNSGYADHLPVHHCTEYGEFKVRKRMYVKNKDRGQVL